jgi:uncharacterized coiled-coil protein SlyX
LWEVESEKNKAEELARTLNSKLPELYLVISRNREEVKELLKSKETEIAKLEETIGALNKEVEEHKVTIM